MPAEEVTNIFNSFLLLGILILFGSAFIVFVMFFLFRSKSRNQKKFPIAFDRVLFLVSLPKNPSTTKERESNQPQYIKNQIALAESLFSSIGGLKAQRGVKTHFSGRSDHISFEIVAHHAVISFYISVPRVLLNYVQQMVLAQYPEAHLEEVKNYNIFSPFGKTAACYLTFSKEYIFPLKTYIHMENDPLNSIANSLSKIASNESASVQFVLRSAKKEWHSWGFKAAQELQKGTRVDRAVRLTAPGITGPKVIKAFSNPSKNKKRDDISQTRTPQLTPLAQEMIKSLEQKTSKAGVEANIRIVVSSTDEKRAQNHLTNIVESFNQFSNYQYGNSLKIRPGSMKELIHGFIYREFYEKWRVLLNSEEMASLYHLPHSYIETPNINWLLAKRLSAPVEMPASGLMLGENTYQGTKIPIYIKEGDRRRHMYMIGMTGTGKSTLIENLVIQDILLGHGVGVIDPHGSLIENILPAIPKERIEDVVLFDASDTERPFGLNILEADTPEAQDLAIQEMIAIFYKLVTDPSMIGPMFEHNMRNAMLTLMADKEHPGTIVDIPRIFTDPEFQKYKIQKLTDPLVKNFWEKEMKKTSDFHKSEMLGYLISKVGRFIENAMVRNIIGQPKSSFDFRDVMDSKKILLVNLSKGKIGEINSSLLGLILVSKLQMAALGRADLPENKRHDFYLYIDEFQNFITDSISIILAEARKYRLNLIMAHQYLGQLTGGSGVEGKSGNSKTRDAIFGNVGTIVTFRIGVEDAEVLAKQLAPGVNEYDLMNIEKYNAYVRLLIDNHAAKTFNIHCFPPIAGDPRISRAVREISRLKYGRPKNLVEKEIIENLKLGIQASEPKQNIEKSL